MPRRLVHAADLHLDSPFTGLGSVRDGLDEVLLDASLDALDDHFMLRDHPGVFIAGEMLDWEAPTGGYLLQACFATGVAAANGILAWRDATRG